MTCKTTILEAITKENVEIVTESTNTEYNNQPKEVRMLAYKFLVDSFNSKYTNLSESQKKVLRSYISNVDNSAKLRSVVINETKRLKKEFSKVKVSDKVAKIKLIETVNLIDNIANSKVINENQILSILRYHELLQELRRLSNV